MRVLEPRQSLRHGNLEPLIVSTAALQRSQDVNAAGFRRPA